MENSARDGCVKTSIMSAAAPARGKAILAISIRLKKSDPYAARVIHCHKMGFFHGCCNSKTAGPDHDDFGLNQSKIINVIEINNLEHDVITKVYQLWRMRLWARR